LPNYFFWRHGISESPIEAVFSIEIGLKYRFRKDLRIRNALNSVGFGVVLHSVSKSAKQS
jgi:hypothetical protein